MPPKPTPYNRGQAGLVSKNDGSEFVIAAGGNLAAATDIFDLATGTWRPGKYLAYSLTNSLIGYFVPALFYSFL